MDPNMFIGIVCLPLPNSQLPAASDSWFEVLWLFSCGVPVVQNRRSKTVRCSVMTVPTKTTTWRRPPPPLQREDGRLSVGWDGKQVQKHLKFESLFHLKSVSSWNLRLVGRIEQWQKHSGKNLTWFIALSCHLFKLLRQFWCGKELSHHTT